MGAGMHQQASIGKCVEGVQGSVALGSTFEKVVQWLEGWW